MVASHRYVDTEVIGIRAPLDVTDLPEGEMRWKGIFRSTRGFAGVAADAVVGVKMKPMLKIPVGPVRKRGFSVDDERLPGKIGVEPVKVNDLRGMVGGKHGNRGGPMLGLPEIVPGGRSIS
jgi:hypothetical protein